MHKLSVMFFCCSEPDVNSDMFGCNNWLKFWHNKMLKMSVGLSTLVWQSLLVVLVSEGVHSERGLGTCR